MKNGCVSLSSVSLQAEFALVCPNCKAVTHGDTIDVMSSYYDQFELICKKCDFGVSYTIVYEVDVFASSVEELSSNKTEEQKEDEVLPAPNQINMFTNKTYAQEQKNQT